MTQPPRVSTATLRRRIHLNYDSNESLHSEIGYRTQTHQCNIRHKDSGRTTFSKESRRERKTTKMQDAKLTSKKLTRHTHTHTQISEEGY